MLSIVWGFFTNLFSWVMAHKQWALSILLALVCGFLILSVRSKDDKINHLTHDTQALDSAKKDLEAEMNGLSLKLTFKNKTYDVLVSGKDGKDIAHSSGYIPDEGSITFKEFKLVQSRFRINADGTRTPITGTASNDISGTVETRLEAKVVDKLTDGWFSKLTKWLHDAFIGPTVSGENSQILIHDRGFTFKPGLGLTYDRNQKYGVNLGVDVKILYYKRLSAGLGLTPDTVYLWGSTHLDKLSLGYINNFELMMGYGMPFGNMSGGGRFVIGLRSNL